MRPIATAPIILAIVLPVLVPRPVNAATATATFSVTLAITTSCQILSTNSLNFGNQGLLTTPVNATTTFGVQCANTVPYNLGLDAGTTPGGTTTTRLLTDGAADTVQYKLYQDAAHTLNWGDTIGTDTAAGTGTGAPQTLTVFGQIPSQATPAPTTYSDVITITMTY